MEAADRAYAADPGVYCIVGTAGVFSDQFPLAFCHLKNGGGSFVEEGGSCPPFHLGRLLFSFHFFPQSELAERPMGILAPPVKRNGL